MAKRSLNLLLTSTKGDRFLYIDAGNQLEILNFLRQSPRYDDKFKYTIDIILNHQATKDIWEKEDVSDKARDVYAIKLFKGSDNARIYCKTYDREDGFHIIMCEFLARKKSTKVKARNKKLIEKVGGYEYEIE